MATLKVQSNGPLYINTVIGTVAVDTPVNSHCTMSHVNIIWYSEERPVTPTQSPPRCTKCNSPTINGHCTNFISFNVEI